MPDASAIRTSDGIVLTPDPSVLTRETIDREITALDKKREVELQGVINAFNARLDAMDKAVAVFSDNLTRVPTDVDKQVGNLDRLTTEKFGTINQQFVTVTERFAAIEQRFRERDIRFDQATRETQHALAIALTSVEKFIDERFHGVDTQFLERDTRVKESATATATAVAAALQAAKEAVGEQNKSFTVSIDKSEKATGEQITQQRILLETNTRGLNDKIDDLKDRMNRIEGSGVGRTAAVSETRAAATDQRAMFSIGISVVLMAIAIMTLVLRLH